MASVSAANQDFGNQPHAIPTHLLADAGLPKLSAQLRAETAALHERIENLLRLPDAIRTRDEYRDWLGHFLGFHEPLGALLSGLAENRPSGSGHSALPPNDHAARLADDLSTLGTNVSCLPRATAQLPCLPSFAHVLGAYYVVEGAALGGRVILRDIAGRIGDQIAGATQFFEGRELGAGFGWTQFRATIDEFGSAYPQSRAGVVTGARRTFLAMIAWFETASAPPSITRHRTIRRDGAAS